MSKRLGRRASTRRRRQCPCASSRRAISAAISTSEPVAIRITLRARLGVLEAIGAARAEVFGRRLDPHRGQVLARQRKHARPVVGQRRGPAFGGLDRVGRAIDGQVGDQPQRLEMLDRLVRRPILAKPDRIVGHDVDDARVLQRAEADRVAAIVGEDQEGAAVRHHPAVERHAVHRRGHAELADAVIDVAPAIIGRIERLQRLGLGVVRPGQVGRAADRRRAPRC